MFSFFKRPQHRVFDYQPRYYKPEEDIEEKEKERRKRKLGFQSARRRKKLSWYKLIIYIVLAIVLTYLYLKILNIR